MAVPTVTSKGEPGPSTQAQSQKAMTKAERRELQEKQRAAKEAAKQVNAGATKSNAKNASAPKTPQSKPTLNTKAALSPKSLPAQKAPTTPTASSFKQRASRRVSISDTVLSQPTGSQRGLRIFSHFGLTSRAGATLSTTKDVQIHPAVVRLALLFSSFKIVGANARCIATLTAFKTVIQDYTTPPSTTLSRHLMTHLSPQISHLVAARPMSVTMGNAIRQLKLEISGSDIDMPEQDAKDELCRTIDDYIRDRIIIADEVIQELAGNKIKNGDVVLTYARSSVVEKVLLNALEEGKTFSVIVVDSRPMLEGKKLLSVLANAGIPCTYLLLPAIGSVITEVSTVLLGAHSLHSNGAVFSRAGTALVALLAKQHSVPVVVCCETYKFSEGVQLDGFTKNELAPTGDIFSSFPITRTRESLLLQGQLNLEILNPLYDLTPPTSITAVVTEVGLIPPSSISSIPLALGKTTL